MPTRTGPMPDGVTVQSVAVGDGFAGGVSLVGVLLPAEDAVSVFADPFRSPEQPMSNVPDAMSDDSMRTLGPREAGQLDRFASLVPIAGLTQPGATAI